MSDLGSIAASALLGQGSPNQGPTQFLKRLFCGAEAFALGGKDIIAGNPDTPCLRMDTPGVFRFRWIVTAGSRTISISVQQAVNLSPRPTLVVKANVDIGINADVTATAPSGAGWVTIGPAAITPSAAGAVWVELHANYDGQLVPCYWDHIIVT